MTEHMGRYVHFNTALSAIGTQHISYGLLCLSSAELIVTSRYLKSGNQKNKTKRRNYTKYIATRETVEIRSQKFVDRNANATKNQEKLINDLINDFPESKRYLE